MGVARGSGSSRDLTDGLVKVLDTVSRFLVGAGLLATITGLGFLIFHIVVFSGDTTISVQTAQANIDLFRKIMAAGLVAFFVGSAYLYWGAEWLALMQLSVSAGLYFAPLYFPSILTTTKLNPVVAQALAEMQRAGGAAGILAIGVMIVDLVTRVQTRMRQGVRADQLKYGKGVREETGRQNVFLGKCWQLPYCRQFVRDRCPIYHARRACWR